MFKKETIYFFFKASPHEVGREGWGWKLGWLPKTPKSYFIFHCPILIVKLLFSLFLCKQYVFYLRSFRKDFDSHRARLGFGNIPEDHEMLQVRLTYLLPPPLTPATTK